MTEPDTGIGFAENIAPELQAACEIVEIATLRAHPDNPREHRVDKIAQSLADHGQRKPVIVDPDGVIVAGHGMVEAAQLLGWQHVAVIRQVFENTDEQLGYLFADNRASDLSSYKREKLLRGLNKLAEGPGIMDTLFEVQELEDLREELQPLAELPDTGAGEYDEDGEEDSSAEGLRLPGERLHEVPILLTDEDYRSVMDWLRALQREWSLKGVTDTVVASIKYAAQHVGEHKEAEGGLEEVLAAEPMPYEVSEANPVPLEVVKEDA